MLFDISILDQKKKGGTAEFLTLKEFSNTILADFDTLEETKSQIDQFSIKKFLQSKELFGCLFLALYRYQQPHLMLTS